MILQERQPVLGRVAATLHGAQISRHTPLRDDETELLKFTVDLRGSPILVLLRQSSDQARISSVIFGRPPRVPTATFQLLYCFFVIEHGRRRILRFNVTDHPTAEWVVQQLREAFPEVGPYLYAIFDRDSTFNEEVVAFLEATGLKPKRTSIQAPQQNGIAERWIGRRPPRLL